MSNKIDLSGLDAPGCGVKQPVSLMPAVVTETPAPVVASIIEQPAIAQHATGARCQSCGQPLPPAPVIERPVFVVDPNADRTDLPPRSVEEVRRLIASGEPVEARERRIINDKMRFAWQREMSR